MKGGKVPRWEYLVVVVNGAGEYMTSQSRFDKKGDWQYNPINELGAKGWELVAVDFNEEGGLGFFKRPLLCEGIMQSARRHERRLV